MVQFMRNLTLFIVAAGLGATLACSTATPTNTNSAIAPDNRTKATGTITADPNPIKVCDKSEEAITKLTWSASGASEVEVRISSPNGGLFTHTTAAGGSAPTGKWVRNGTVIYLQDVSGGKPLTAENTIASVTINFTTAGCP